MESDQVLKNVLVLYSLLCDGREAEGERKVGRKRKRKRKRDRMKILGF